MKQTFARLGRLTLISLAAFSVATISNVFNHLKYWKGTIFAVQTVDFNILSHTLPTKLSILLIQENTKEIQRTLNSNYGLWIKCNSWHLRSIVKNVLYNSNAALMNFYEEHDCDVQCKISVTCVRVGNEAGILVEDNGSGFNEETLERLYQIPNTVDENAEATRGRGSIIVFSYLSLHGGRVELANIPEGGAKAMFLFPLTAPL